MTPRLPAMVRRAARNLGPQGMFGIVMALAAAAVHYAAALPAQDRIAHLRAQAQSVRELARQASREAAAPRAESQLEKFHKLLPEAASAPDWVGKIFAIAQKESLVLDHGEYKISSVDKARIATYQINLPVRGSYVQIRKFIAGVLEEVPSAALDDIVLKRDNVSRPEIEASIRFTLFLAQG